MSKYIVGKDPAADVVITGQNTVSRQHVSLEPQADGSTLVTDLGSTNGTFVEAGVGRIAVSRQVLQSTDTLLLGHYRTSVGDLLAQVPAAPTPNPASPKTKGYSRYVRTATGQFEKKES